MGSLWWLSIRSFHWLMSSPLRLLLFETAVTFPHLSGLHKSQNTSMALKNMLLKNRNCLKISRIWQKIGIDSPICRACTTAKTLQYLPLLKAYFPPIWCFWRFPNNGAHLVLLAQKDNNYLYISSVGFPKGWSQKKANYIYTSFVGFPKDWRQKKKYSLLLFIYHYSPDIVHPLLFTCYCSWHLRILPI